MPTSPNPTPIISTLPNAGTPPPNIGPITVVFPKATAPASSTPTSGTTIALVVGGVVLAGGLAYWLYHESKKKR